jgi:hypothetical protein
MMVGKMILFIRMVEALRLTALEVHPRKKIRINIFIQVYKTVNGVRGVEELECKIIKHSVR